MANKKTLKVFSTATVAGMMAAAVLSSQAFAAVNSYSVKVGDNVYKYEKTELTKAFLQAKTGEKSALYDDFTAKLSEAKGFYAFEDSKNGFVDYSAIQAKFLEAKANGKTFDVDAFAESKDAKVIEIATVKKAVVNKDGKVEYEEETSKGDKNAEVSIKSVEALSLKQIKVNFVKAVTSDDKKDDIEDEENYTIYNDEKNEIEQDIEKVELDNSGKFAIITMKDNRNGNEYEAIKDSKDGIVNQERYTIEFDENITGKEVKEDVKFKDYAMPEVEKIEVNGEDSIKIKFSEPVRPDHFENNVPYLDDDDIEINNDDISVNKIELTNNNTEATVKVGYTLKDKQKLKVRVKGSIEDYAGYGVKSVIKEDIVVKKDNSKPEVKSFKNAKKNKVTLVFEQDIKFKDSDQKSLDNRNGLDDFYHTNTTNKANRVELDGRELTLYFDDDAELPANGDAYVNIKSGALETLWNVENDKIVTPVRRVVDNSKLEIRTVEQDKDNGDQIIVKFSKEVDEKEAEKVGNYTLKDKDGDKWNITKVEKDKDNNKKVTITTSKKLDSGKYELTIKDVEDTAGKAIDKVTQKFTATEKDARVNKDLTINLYKSGKSEQKLVVDFDTKMKTDGKNSIKDIDKYTLVAEENVFGKKHDKKVIKVSDLYGKNIKAIEDGKKVQIDIPCKKNKDDSYEIAINADGTATVDGKNAGKLKLVIGKVADVDNNINSVELSQTIEGPATIEIKKKKGEKLAKSIASDKVEVVFDDSVNFKNNDVKLYAIGQKYIDKKGKMTVKDLDKAIANKEDVQEVKVSGWDNDSKNGRTIVTMTLDKNQTGSVNKNYDDNKDHVLSYDGKFDGKDLYVVTIADPESHNDYDAAIKGSLSEKIMDNIAPAIVDNSKRDEKHRYVKNGEFGSSNNNDQAVEFYREKDKDGEDADTGRIVLTFEEPIADYSLNRNTFKLDQDGDFKTVRVDSVEVNKDNACQVVINVHGLQGIKKGAIFGQGFDVTQNAPIADLSQINRGQGNQVEGIKTQIGDFDNLYKVNPDVKPVEVDKTALNKAIEEASKKVEKDYTVESWKAADLTKVVEAAKLVANNDKATKENVEAQVKAIKDASAKLKLVKHEDEKGKNYVVKAVKNEKLPGTTVIKIVFNKGVDVSKFDVKINDKAPKFVEKDGEAIYYLPVQEDLTQEKAETMVKVNPIKK